VSVMADPRIIASVARIDAASVLLVCEAASPRPDRESVIDVLIPAPKETDPFPAERMELLFTHRSLWNDARRPAMRKLIADAHNRDPLGILEFLEPKLAEEGLLDVFSDGLYQKIVEGIDAAQFDDLGKRRLDFCVKTFAVVKGQRQRLSLVEKLVALIKQPVPDPAVHWTDQRRTATQAFAALPEDDLPKDSSDMVAAAMLTVVPQIGDPTNRLPMLGLVIERRAALSQETQSSLETQVRAAIQQGAQPVLEGMLKRLGSMDAGEPLWDVIFSAACERITQTASKDSFCWLYDRIPDGQKGRAVEFLVGFVEKAAHNIAMFALQAANENAPSITKLPERARLTQTVTDRAKRIPLEEKPPYFDFLFAWPVLTADNAAAVADALVEWLVGSDPSHNTFAAQQLERFRTKFRKDTRRGIMSRVAEWLEQREAAQMTEQPWEVALAYREDLHSGTAGTLARAAGKLLHAPDVPRQTRGLTYAQALAGTKFRRADARDLVGDLAPLIGRAGIEPKGVYDTMKSLLSREHWDDGTHETLKDRLRTVAQSADTDDTKRWANHMLSTYDEDSEPADTESANE